MKTCFAPVRSQVDAIDITYSAENYKGLGLLRREEMGLLTRRNIRLTILIARHNLIDESGPATLNSGNLLKFLIL